MIHFHTLGELSLRDDDARGVASVLAQPKRIALLAYLAIARPGGFQRRDTLLALFWPESPNERARHSLSQAIYKLRQGLGEQVIITRRGEEVGIDPERLWCDAVAFDRALDAGEPAAALELYAGELLTGFHLDDAPGFERWLEAERARLRERALEALRARAAEQEREGNPVAAIHSLRSARRWAPSDGVVVGELLRLLVAVGDRSGAVEEYEAFARHLQQDLELEPSADLKGLVVEIRRARSEPAPRPSSPGSTEAEPPPRERPRPGGTATAPARRMGPRPRLAPAALALLVLLLAAGAIARGGPGPTPPPSPSRIAVLPFTVEGGDRFAYLGEGVVDLLSVKLSVPEWLQTVDPRPLLTFLQDGERVALDPDRGRAVAERFGAGFFVLGTIVEAGGRLQMSAGLYGVGGARVAVASTTVDEEGALFEALDRLAGELLTELVGSDKPFARTAALTTGSLPALKAYLEGERALRAGHFDAAVAAFQRAVAADTLFALAHTRLGTAAIHAARPELIRGSIERAWELRERLPERARLYLEAIWTNHVAHANPERQLRTGVARYPDDVTFTIELGELLFHHGFWGHPPDESRIWFERALALEPDNASVLLHLARIAAFEGEHEELDSLTARALRASSDGVYATEVRALRALASRDRGALDRTAAEFRLLGDEMLARLVFRTASASGNFEDALLLATAMTDPGRPAELRALGHVTLAHLEAARGRLRVARDHLEAGGAAHPRIVLAGRALLAAHPSLPASGEELARVRTALVGIDALPAPPLAVESVINLLLDTHIPPLLLGLIGIRLGDPDAALGLAAALDASPPDAGSATGSDRFAALLRAAAAGREGRREDALRALGTETRSRATDLAGLEVLLRAELLRELGREEEALRWYGAMLPESYFSLVQLAPSHLRRAEIYDRMGEGERAAEHYARFIELWRDSDAELRPHVRAAERRLDHLRRDGGASAPGKGRPASR